MDLEPTLKSKVSQILPTKFFSKFCFYFTCNFLILKILVKNVCYLIRQRDLKA